MQVRLRDETTNGLGIAPTEGLRENMDVVIRRTGMKDMRARVAWVSDKGAGLELRDESGILAMAS